MPPARAAAPPSLGDVVAQRGRSITMVAGQVLFREGDDSRSVYACTAGRVNLFVTTPAGREVMLGSKVPVQAFGELSALDGGARSATAIAMERTTIAQLTAEEFLHELDHAPALSLTLLRELTAHLRVSNARASARASDSVTVRVAHLLIELSEKFRRHADPNAKTELPITQDELAAWVGSTREAVARSLGTLRRDQLVDTGRNRITVSDPARLLLLATGGR